MNFPIRPSFPCLKFPLSAFRFPLFPHPSVASGSKNRCLSAGRNQAFGEGGFKAIPRVSKGFKAIQSIHQEKKDSFLCSPKHSTVTAMPSRPSHGFASKFSSHFQGEHGIKPDAHCLFHRIQRRIIKGIKDSGLKPVSVCFTL